ncbi:CLIPC1 [Trypoxylus dichotomus]
MFVSAIFSTYILFVFTLHGISTQIDEICVTDLSEVGKCLLARQCPSAIQLIKERKQPKLCGFQGSNPIVCCKTINVNIKSKYGAITKRKCEEYITATALTTTTTTTTTTPLPPGTPPEENMVYYAVGGEDADPLEFPHMKFRAHTLETQDQSVLKARNNVRALLGYGPKEDIQWECGGSLISEKFVLTAAHCIYSRFGQVAHVLLGVHQISYINFEERFSIRNIHRHPNYQPFQRYNDIALIELDREVFIGPFTVRPACLQTEKNIDSNIFVATGWGAVKLGGENSDILQKVNLTAAPFQICSRFHQPQKGLEKGLTDESQICAGSVQEIRDTCQGDSGGPLQVKLDGTNLYTILGITSFGVKCGQVPGVYTRVSYYIPWIESIVWPDNE